MLNSPSCGCCNQIDTCGCRVGSQPPHYTVTIAGVIDDLCDACSSFNGSFILPRVVDCNWHLDRPASVCNCPYDTSVQDWLHVRVSKASGIAIISLTLQHASQYYCDDARFGLYCRYHWNANGYYVLFEQACGTPTTQCSCEQFLYIAHTEDVIYVPCSRGPCRQFNASPHWQAPLPDDHCDHLIDFPLAFVASGAQGLSCVWSGATVLLTAS